MSRNLLRGALPLACAAALIIVLGSTGAAAQPGAKKPTMKIKCTTTTYNVSYPQLSGLNLSTFKCSKPFGAGVQRAVTKTKATGSQVTVTGTFKNFFDTGTNHGTVSLSGKVTTGTITASGSLTVTGGTGAYKGMKGTGKISCTTSDAGKTFHCKVTGTGTL